MSNPVKDFTKKEWSLWLGSLLIVVVSNLFPGMWICRPWWRHWWA